ncbi:MAG: DMT family transporter [Vicinamibacterales bacterium]
MANPPDARLRLQDRLGPWLVTLSAMLWALDAPFRKLLTADLSSTVIVLLEHLLVSLCVLPLLLPRLAELRGLRRQEWLAVVFVGFGGSASATVLFTESFHYVNPTVAVLLQKLQPLIAITLASALLGERPSRRFWTWAAIAMGGAYLVSFPDLVPTGLSGGANARGVLLALGAAAFWGGSTVFGRFVLNRASFQVMTGLRFTTGLVWLAVVNLSLGRIGEVANASARDWLLVFALAVVAGFISLLVYYYGLRSTRASVATMCELAYPLSSVLLNWVLLGAALSPVQVAGGAILLGAITRLAVNDARKPDALPVPRDLARGAGAAE